MNDSENTIKHGMRLPSNLAFVVQLSTDSLPEEDRLMGRIEHVVSGKTLNFQSCEELLRFLAQVIGKPE